MLAKFTALVQSLIADKAFKDDSEIFQYYTLQLAVLFGAASYLGLGVLFLCEGLWHMALLDAVGMAAMVVGLLLVRGRGHFKTVGLLFSLFTICTITLHILSIGAGYYLVLYYILVLMLQVVTPYAARGQRIAVLVLLGLCMVSTTWHGLMAAPFHYIRRVGLALALYNLAIGVIGIGLYLVLLASVRNILANYGASRLADMTYRASSDALTGLYNDRYAYQFFDVLQRSRANENWCISILDIDNFKQLNETHGSHVGDVVLARLAEYLCGELRRTDIVCRWGGEEFLLILQGVRLGDARVVLEKLRRNIAELDIPIGDETLRVQVTIGVAELDLDDVEASMELCTQKMYIGKNLGKNRVVG